MRLSCFRELKSSRAPRGRLKGFTLIELLIVIAIILILIAIALPNFLEAQIRARVTKANGEIRSLVTAMEAYFLDFQTYPNESEADWVGRPINERGLVRLTTPIAYLTAIPQDPFSGQDDQPIFYELGGAESIKLPQLIARSLDTWALYTRGPDAPNEDVKSANPHYEVPGDGEVNHYSPTNGTKSGGDIFHYGGDPFFIGVPISAADLKAAKTTPPTGLPVDGQIYIHKLPPGIF